MVTGQGSPSGADGSAGVSDQRVLQRAQRGARRWQAEVRAVVFAAVACVPGCGPVFGAARFRPAGTLCAAGEEMGGVTAACRAPRRDLGGIEAGEVPCVPGLV